MNTWQALGMGLGLGVGAGITPGPLLSLILHETLRNGWRAGVLIAFAPPVADLAVVALCFLVLERLPLAVLPILGIGGGLYVMSLAWEALQTVAPDLPSVMEAKELARQSFGKGIIVNLLNPHPYVFWLTVGGPVVMQSYQRSALVPIVAFVGGFYGCLVGSKLLLALLVHSGRAQLQRGTYQIAARASGGLLLLFGLLLLWGGVRGL